jgi:hypothetical protein
MRYWFVCLLFVAGSVSGQQLFGDACRGTWTGTMHIYRKGVVKDSVGIRLEVAPVSGGWTWKTHYLSPKHPMVKDYLLRYKEENHYVIDEQDGTVLDAYLTDNKLFSVFETEGIVLTSGYELRGKNRLVFEVTSGRKGVASSVINYSVDHVQRVLLRRTP